MGRLNFGSPLPKKLVLTLVSRYRLNLVLMRPGVFYGDFTVTGFTPRALIGEVYKFQAETMEFLQVPLTSSSKLASQLLIREMYRWSDSLACNTCHIDDFSSALVSAAMWAKSLGSRSAILSAYSVNLPPAIDSNKPLEALTSGPSPVKPAKKEEKDIRAAVFNVEDGGDTRQKVMSKLIEEVIGVKTGYHGTLISTFAKLNLSDVVADANEKVSSLSRVRSFSL